VQQHLAACADCRAELALLAPAQEMLLSWQHEPAPDWERSHAQSQPLAAPAHRPPLPGRHARLSWKDAGRWVPLAASLVLSVAVLTQTRLDVSEQGWQLSFGGDASNVSWPQLDAYMAAQASLQQQQNQQMLESALQQFGDNTADTLVQLVDWFEQQRELDIQRMEAGFQQLLDRDYQTVNSVQQLASYVQFQGDLP
tara:strand:- start:4836 stop:5426 length:591 start_codon:yes stop_codon:yes gene_type:complete